MSIQINKDKRKEFFRKGTPHKFIIVDKDAFLDDRLSYLSRFLLITLNDCAEKFHPCIKSLAKQFDVSDTTIDNAIKELKKYGYLTSEGSRSATKWIINMETKLPLKA